MSEQAGEPIVRKVGVEFPLTQPLREIQQQMQEECDLGFK